MRCINDWRKRKRGREARGRKVGTDPSAHSGTLGAEKSSSLSLTIGVYVYICAGARSPRSSGSLCFFLSVFSGVGSYIVVDALLLRTVFPHSTSLPLLPSILSVDSSRVFLFIYLHSLAFSTFFQFTRPLLSLSPSLHTRHSIFLLYFVQRATYIKTHTRASVGPAAFLYVFCPNVFVGARSPAVLCRDTE